METERVMELDADFDTNEVELEVDMEDIYTVDVGGTSDYRKLKNKPSINGTELYDNYNEIDPTVPAWAKQNSKPNYTASEVNAVNRDSFVTESEIDLMFLKIFGS